MLVEQKLTTKISTYVHNNETFGTACATDGLPEMTNIKYDSLTDLM